MTQEEIIELAKQAGFFVKDSEAYSPSVQEDHELTPYLETFAKRVAEAERESCAAICDALHEARVGKDNYFAFAANAIRELRAKQ
jgi:uncharacterized protein YqfA (UPF0365 family)